MQNDRQMRQGILPLPCALFRREREQTEKLGEEEECLEDEWEDLFLGT